MKCRELQYCYLHMCLASNFSCRIRCRVLGKDSSNIRQHHCGHLPDLMVTALIFTTFLHFSHPCFFQSSHAHSSLRCLLSLISKMLKTEGLPCFLWPSILTYRTVATKFVLLCLVACYTYLNFIYLFPESGHMPGSWKRSL